MTDESTDAPSRFATMSTKTFAIFALLVCLVFAGLVSYYASGHPDGLNRVAADQGLAAKEESSVTADSPLAGYSTRPVDNDWLSGAIAGGLGVIVVLLIAGGLSYAVRRRSSSAES